MLKKVMIMACYDKFNSYRIMKMAMQDITELFQYVFSRTTQNGPSFL